jgi:hypothetical protein
MTERQDQFLGGIEAEFSSAAPVFSVGFPNIGLQGFAPKLAKGEIASLSGAADDPRYFQISVPMRVAQATSLCRPTTRRTA